MRLAIINPHTLYVVNIIEVDERNFPVPAPYFTVQSDVANIGDAYEDGVFIPPIPEPEPDPIEPELPLPIP